MIRLKTWFKSKIVNFISTAASTVIMGGSEEPPENFYEEKWNFEKVLSKYLGRLFSKPPKMFKLGQIFAFPKTNLSQHYKKLQLQGAWKVCDHFI